ncbi:TIGR04222 domain-containing membrane protein [Streptomyces sp. G-G2]|uniref:TIGR04222 domain-containing membrane protein n=1 Tax=Streptomyces sp. G-G2 TaxID=3046201 RepID=UPI0024BACE00|nr:TIGR04222 domain-containing membrane protein [Streptomyces sp. G-G2]MDJ0385179.1 TIGR04222 domain-containing membrane protein [Streptomyces sp. G-G2]
MIAEVAAGAAWLLVLAAAAVRSGAGRGPSPTALPLLSPVEVGLLRAGHRGAAQTALVELYLAGSVEAASRQTVRRDDTRAPKGLSGPARAQYAVLYGRLHPRRLQGLDRVRRAVADVSRDLETSRLVLPTRRLYAVRALSLAALCAVPVGAIAGRAAAPWLFLALLADAVAVWLCALPRRTRRGAALLARLRRERADVRRASEREPEELLLSIALFGASALRAQLPGFTAASGLLTRPPREPMDRGGGSAETVASCGG